MAKMNIGWCKDSYITDAKATFRQMAAPAAAKLCTGDGPSSYGGISRRITPWGSAGPQAMPAGDRSTPDGTAQHATLTRRN